MATNTKKTNGVEHRRQEVQQAVKNACDYLNSDGVNPRDYVEQLAWMFFLKAFDEAETRREQESAFEGTPYARRLDGPYRWSEWSKLTDKPDEMLKFVDGDLWVTLQNLGEDTIAERFRRIFGSVKNHARRGATFARVVQQVNRFHFGDASDVIVLSEIYENLLKDVAADSAGYAGEFYTQRHVIRAMVEVVKPRLGERIYDPCVGTAGFLVESAEYVRRHAKSLSAGDLHKLDTETFYGLELKPLSYLLGSMNMILHRVEGANLELGNTLERHSGSVPDKNKYQVILSNPPYGGKMARELQSNFTIPSGSTETLFVQHIMANLSKGGRAGVIVPEGVLFRGGPDQKVRERLLREFDVHTVLSLPAGVFLPYTGVKTNVLFFDRRKDDRRTESVWFYELTNDGFELKQTRKPIDGNQLPDFLAKQRDRVDSGNSWTLSIDQIAKRSYDLSAKNPNRVDDYDHKPALELLQSMKAREARVMELLEELEILIESKP